MAHTSAILERPMRADARRNRERILVAARQVFAAAGLDAQMDDVARDAGVGVGTVYRHFPTKEELVRALIEHKFSVLAERARAIRAEEPDPWRAFARILWTGGELHAADRSLAQVWSTQPAEVFRAAAERSGLRQLTADALREAQQTGAVRADVTVDDVPMTMCALGSVVEATAPGAPSRWERLLGLVLDGMRAPGAQPLGPARR